MIFKFNQLAADPFNRANENPLNPTLWTIATTWKALQIVSDTVEATVSYPGGSVELYTANNFPNNQYAQVQIVQCINGNEFDIILRSDLAGENCYDFEFIDNENGTANVGFGVASESSIPESEIYLWENLALPYSQNDVFGFGVIGYTLYAFQNGTCIASATDPDSYYSSGLLGLGIEISSASLSDLRLNNFSAGQFSAYPALQANGPKYGSAGSQMFQGNIV